MDMLLWTSVYNFFLCGCVVLIALDTYLGVGSTGSQGILCLTLRICHTDLLGNLAVDIQTSDIRGFQFLHMLVNTCYCLLSLECGHLSECEVVPVHICP